MTRLIDIHSTTFDPADVVRGPRQYGYRCTVAVNDSLLTPAALTLLDALRNDLSGHSSDDDLIPSPHVRERNVSILRAAETLGYGKSAADRWAGVYPELRSESVTTRPYQFYGLQRAYREGRLESAINAAALTPGLHVRATLHSPLVQIGSAEHVDPSASARSFAHMCGMDKWHIPGTAEVRAATISVSPGLAA